MTSNKRLTTTISILIVAAGLSGCASLTNLLGPDAETIARDAWAAWREYQATLAAGQTNAAATATNAIQTVDAIADQRACAWFDNAKVRCMNIGAMGNTPEYVQGIIDRQKASGADTAWIFAHNTGDGSPVPTTIYAGSDYGGAVSSERVAQLRTVLAMHRAAGMRIVLWLTADDSKPIYTATRAQHLAHVAVCIEHLGDLVDEICIGLEMDSDGRSAHAAAMIAHAKTLTKKRVGVHLNKGKWESAIAWGADVLYYQHGPETNPIAASNEFVAIVKAVNGRAAVVASEFHLSCDSDQARAIGAAIAAVPGCAGTGSGRR